MGSLDWKYAVLDVPDGGLAIDRAASGAELAALARELEILGVEKLDMRARVRAAGEGRYHLTGQIKTRVTQACVVTLEPVPEDMTLALDIHFVPEHLMPPPIPAATEGEDSEDSGEAQLCEPIVNGVMDIGELIFQEVAANLDPYPRLAEASLDKSEAGPAGEEASHPFAKLKQWAGAKDKDGAGR